MLYGTLYVECRLRDILPVAQNVIYLIKVRTDFDVLGYIANFHIVYIVLILSALCDVFIILQRYINSV